MTRFESIMRQMTKSDTPHLSILCGYYMGMKSTCSGCSMRHWCDCDPVPSDEWMEEWLMQEVKDEQ